MRLEALPADVTEVTQLLHVDVNFKTVSASVHVSESFHFHLISKFLGVT